MMRSMVILRQILSLVIEENLRVVEGVVVTNQTSLIGNKRKCRNAGNIICE
jgi:hypothetical protein